MIDYSNLYLIVPYFRSRSHYFPYRWQRLQAQLDADKEEAKRLYFQVHEHPHFPVISLP